MEQDNVETGWLLDDGRLCVGAGGIGLDMVTYDSALAIRFARKQDAETFRFALPGLGMRMMSHRCDPVEHRWG